MFRYLIIFWLSCNSLIAQDNSDWVDLFNGKNLEDWIVKTYHHETGEDTLQTFRVKDNMIQVRYDKYGNFDDQFSHLYYKKPYSYYHFKIDYQFTGELQQGAPPYTLLNSGVMFHCLDPYTMKKEQNWPISVELQFLAGLGDGKPRSTGNLCSPGTHVVVNGKLEEQHVIRSSAKTYHKDEWIRAELIVLGDSLITHIINGDTVLRYSQPQIGGEVVNGFDPSVKIDGKALTEGFIALQSEGQPINFKNIKLLNLKGCMDPKAKNYKDYYVKDDSGSCIYN
jgi:hypothetical protein